MSSDYFKSILLYKAEVCYKCIHLLKNVIYMLNSALLKQQRIYKKKLQDV